MKPHEKARLTIIEAHRQPGMTDEEAWEAFKQKRYLDPAKAEERSASASHAAKHIPKELRGFSKPGVASAAAKKSWEARREAR